MKSDGFPGAGTWRRRARKGGQTQARQALAGLAASLERLAHETEDDFIAMGLALQTIQAEAAALQRQATANTDIFRPGHERSVLLMIEQAVKASRNSAEALLDDAEQQRSALAAIAALLNSLAAVCESLQKSGLFLRVLGVNTAIEISRSEQTLADFSIVSNDTLSLAERVREIAGELSKQTLASEAELIRISDSTAHNLQPLAALVTKAGQNAEEALKECAALVARALAAMEHAAALSRDISKGIGQVIVGIQFHDSFRQRLEHIIQVLEDAACLLPEKDGRIGLEADGKQPAHEVFYTIELQKRQLQQLIGETEDLYRNQSLSFQEIEDAIVQLSACLGRIAGGEGAAESRDALASIAAALTTTEAIRGDCLSLARGFNQATSDTGQATSLLSGFVGEILALSWRVHLNALNSIIKAAKLGSDGKTLEVLSQHMVLLAGKVKDMVPEFTDRIERITEIAGNGIQEIRGAEEQVLSASFSEEEIRGRFNDFTANARTFLAEGNRLAQAVSRQRENLRFLPRMAEMLKERHRELASLAEAIKTEAGSFIETVNARPLEEIADRYTMAQERIVHAQALAAPVSSLPTPATGDQISFEAEQCPEQDRFLAGPEESLRAPDNDTAAAITPSGQAERVEKSEFGDNVELF